MSQSDRIPLIQGYQLLELLYTGSRTLVYRGIRRVDGQGVVLKMLKHPFPTLQDLLRFRSHYTITKNLNLAGVVQPLSLETYGHGFVLVTPDDGFRSLADYQTSHCLSLFDVLGIALQLTDILHNLYQHRVIHKDIKPANILIHPQSKQIQLIDFGFASLLPKETEESKHPNVLEGTLAYLSPEQTGRMNRGIDYRSDFYALGVTLFELFTGQLPFQSNDVLELVHCHIARPAPSICEFRPEAPAMIGQIVTKLMAKNAEERYQSALGLKNDLERCLTQLQQTGTIEVFELGTRDVSDRFLIPETLYGREPEVQTLLQAFDRVAAGSSELMLVAGFSGIGKTAVVNEVHKPIVRQRGYFIKGKFDQFNRNIPFSAFVQAFRDLMRQLLGESDAQLTTWKAKILQALGENAQVILEVIPELEWTIGQQPPVPKLSGSAAQNRFNLLFQKFIDVFTTKEHPLVMFLDDLQWADSASLNLLKVLMSKASTGYLLILGAYRDNEVFPAHPLMLTLDEIKKNQSIIHTITLAPLSEATVNDLVADTLSCTPELAQPLTQLVYQKTKGNPFFATQFLKALHDDGWIEFQPKLGYWQCDMTSVRQLALTDDVVEFMALQLQKLPVETQEVLKLAACIGNQFELKTLAIISEKSQINTATDLWKALQEGVIIPINDTYKFFQANDSDERAQGDEIVVAYKFLHDRVQQAAYSLIPDDQKQSTHLAIARFLRQNTTDVELEANIFEIANHWNRAIALISDLSEKINLAQLNLIAGLKAKASTAYEAALKYFNIGLILLSDQSWKNQPELMLRLHEGAAEVAYLCGDFAQMEHWVNAVLTQKLELLDRVKTYDIQIQAHSIQSQFPEAIAIAQNALEQFNIHLPKQPTPADIVPAMQEVAELLNGRTIHDLLDLPVMTDAVSLASIQLLSSITPASYISAPLLFPFLVLAQVKLSIQAGNTALSAYSYSVYAILLGGVLGDLDAAYEFGQLGLELVEKFKAQTVQPRVNFIVGTFNIHCKSHCRNSLPLLIEAVKIGLEVGDFEYTGYSFAYLCVFSYVVGKELTMLLAEIEIYIATLLKLNIVASSNYSFTAIFQTIQRLQATRNEDVLTAQKELHNTLTISNDLIALHWYWVYRLTASYLLNEMVEAKHDAAEARQTLAVGAGLISIPIFYFYDSLTALADFSEVTDKAAVLDRVFANQAQLQNLAHHAPMNFQHKYELVEAEQYRILGNKSEAIDSYDRAIAGAKENGYIQEEALANELAAKFYLDWGKEKIAQEYLTNAYYGYAHWGAKAKVDHLEQQYPHLLSPILNSGTTSSPSRDTVASSQTSSYPSTSLDLSTILKTSQTLSGEIQLEHLLQTLIEIVMTNAGADKAVLFLNQGGSLELAIEYFDNAVQSMERQPVDTCQEVSISLIHYVERTLETVITDYKSHSSTLNDPYCLQHQPKSLLGAPILHQGKLVAVLYLENAITSNAFTDNRVKLLNVICAQASIALENARLYQQAQAYAQQLEHSLNQLQTTETRFRHLADNIPGVIFQLCITADGSASVPFTSSGCYTVYEVSAEEMMAGKYNFRDFEYIEDRPAIGQMLADTAHTLQTFRMEFRIITPSGKMKWLQVVSQPERQSDGSLFWQGVAMDISDRKAAEAQLQQQAQQLEQANRQLAEYSQTLEEKVKERTAELTQALTDLQATQTELVQSEKMAALGQLTANIAHEINTPLGVIRGASSNIAAAFHDTLLELPTLLQRLSVEQQTEFLALIHTALEHPVQYSTQEERQRRRQLQSHLVAQGFPHANHLATQLTLLGFGPDRIPNADLLNHPDCVTLLQVAHNLVLQYQSTQRIQQEVDQAAKIVFALNLYSYQNETGEKILAAITDGIEVALTLYQNRLKRGIQVIRHYSPEIANLFCNPSELTQVWVNLIDNALYAMDQQGILEIVVAQYGDRIQVEITDSGCGIPAELQSRIFEPFFTTKPRGEGSGLGLDIVRQIVQKYAGTIQMSSQPGQTTFTVSFPLQ